MCVPGALWLRAVWLWLMAAPAAGMSGSVGLTSERELLYE